MPKKHALNIPPMRVIIVDYVFIAQMATTVSYVSAVLSKHFSPLSEQCISNNCAETILISYNYAENILGKNLCKCRKMSEIAD